MLHDSIYIMFKNKQNSSLVLEVRREAVVGGMTAEYNTRGSSWGSHNVLLLNLGAGYTQGLTL